MENILKLTKLVYSCFYDKNGFIQKEPFGKIARMKLSQECIDFLYRYIEFMMNSKILNEASVIYVKSPYDTTKGVFEMHNREHPDDIINVKTAISNLDYNRRKVNKIFDQDMLTQIIFYSHKADIEKYQKQLDNAMSRYSRGSVFDGKLMIKLPNIISVDKPSNEKIESFKLMISSYRNANRQIIEQRVEDMYGDVVSYFNFLSVLNDRNEEEEEQFQQMSNFLNGKLEIDDIFDFEEIELD